MGPTFLPVAMWLHRASQPPHGSQGKGEPLSPRLPLITCGGTFPPHATPPLPPNHPHGQEWSGWPWGPRVGGGQIPTQSPEAEAVRGWARWGVEGPVCAVISSVSLLNCLMLWSAQESAVRSRTVVGDYIRPLPLAGDRLEPPSVKPAFLSRSATPRCRFESDVSSGVRAAGGNAKVLPPFSLIPSPASPSHKFPYPAFIDPHVAVSMQSSQMSRPRSPGHCRTGERGERCPCPGAEPL